MDNVSTPVTETPAPEAVPETPSAAPAVGLDPNVEKIAACTKEVNAILEKYGCELDLSMSLRAGSITSNAQVILKK